MRERQVGGLWCSEVLTDLSSYVDGEVDADRRAEIEAHLKQCSVCERFGGEFSGMVAAVRSKLREETLSGSALEGRTLALLRQIGLPSRS